MTSRRWGGAIAACSAVAALSLLLPIEPTFDPFAWLVWGREGLGLDTGGGPSWKPLAVLIAAPLTLFGDAAPELWLLISRTAWLLAALLAGALAWRLSRGRLAATLLAAAAVLLIDDPATPWLRQFAGGLSEPLLLALILAAIESHLAGRRRLPFALLVLASLLRPETWPFLVVYGVWLWRGEEALRPWLAAAAVALPVLWFVPDLLASGDALTGADRARDAGGGPGRVPEAIVEAGNLAPLALLPAALWLAVARRRRGDDVAAVLLAAALAWALIVVVLTVAGFAGLPRFFIPFGGIVCVLGAVGLAELVERPASRKATAVLLLGLLVQAGFRVADLPGDLERSVERSDEVAEIWAFADRVGAETLTACGPLRTSDPVSQSALVWQLGVPFSQLDAIRARPPRRGVVLLGPSTSPVLRKRVVDAGEPLAADGRWTAYAISCNASASSASGARTDGVSGATR